MDRNYIDTVCNSCKFHHPLPKKTGKPGLLSRPMVDYCTLRREAIMTENETKAKLVNLPPTVRKDVKVNPADGTLDGGAYEILDMSECPWPEKWKKHRRPLSITPAVAKENTGV